MFRGGHDIATVAENGGVIAIRIQTVLGSLSFPKSIWRSCVSAERKQAASSRERFLTTGGPSFENIFSTALLSLSIGMGRWQSWGQTDQEAF
jgi:hypothetical protein